MMDQYDNIAIENFISFCNDMQIAEENFSLLHKESKILEKKIALAKLEIVENDGDYQKQKKIIDNIISLLKTKRDEVESLDITKGDKVKSVLKKIGAVILGIPGIIGVPFTFGLSLFPPVLMYKSSDDIYTIKEKTLKIIDETVDLLENFKIALKKDKTMATESVASPLVTKSELRKEYKDIKKLIKEKKYTNIDLSKSDDTFNAYMNEKFKNICIKSNKTEIENITRFVNALHGEIRLLIDKTYGRMSQYVTFNFYEAPDMKNDEYLMGFNILIEDSIYIENFNYSSHALTNDMTNLVSKYNSKNAKKMKTMGIYSKEFGVCGVFNNGVETSSNPNIVVYNVTYAFKLKNK